MVIQKKHITYFNKFRQRIKERNTVFEKFKVYLELIFYWIVYEAVLHSNRRLDKLYQKYLSDPHTAEIFYRENFQDGIPKDAKILDAGCGRGRVAATLTQLEYKIISFDIEKNDFWFKIDNQLFFMADIQFIPLKNESFDVCTNFLVLGYVNDDGKAIKELYRILKSNGILIVHVTNKGNLKTKFSGKLLDEDHLREFFIVEIKNKLASVGFIIEHISTSEFYSPIFTRFVDNIISHTQCKKLGNLVSEDNRGVICIQCRK